MAHYVIFTKVMTLTLNFIRCSGVACTSRTDGQTCKQTNRQTDRGDQYTLQKSTILQSNKQTDR